MEECCIPSVKVDKELMFDAFLSSFSLPLLVSRARLCRLVATHRAERAIFVDFILDGCNANLYRSNYAFRYSMFVISHRDRPTTGTLVYHNDFLLRFILCFLPVLPSLVVRLVLDVAVLHTKFTPPNLTVPKTAIRKCQ